MPVELRLQCASGEDAESLHRWLREEQTIRVDGHLARAHSTNPEMMGAVLGVLTLIIGSGLTAGQLALAIASWRDSRKPSPRVMIVHTATDGSTTVIEAEDPGTLTAALQQLEDREQQ